MLAFFLKHKWFFLGGILIAFFVFYLGSAFLSQTRRPSTLPLYPTPTSVPQGNGSTQVVPFSTLGVFSVFPQDQQGGVLVNSSIIATFTRPVTSKEKGTISLSLSPSVGGASLWDDTNKVFSFVPSAFFATNFVYSATLSYDNKTFTWQFTTESNSSRTLDLQQAINDSRAAAYQEQITTLYPWYSSLPLSGNKYFTTFDTSSLTFTSLLYPSTSSPDNQDAQVNRMQKEIQTKLQRMGVNTTKYQFVWSVTPIP